MNAGDIAFPNLGIYLKDVPISFQVFGFTIYFYAVIIFIGIALGFLMALHVAKKSGQDPELYWDFVIYAVFFSVVGARIYYVIFAWQDYKDNLIKVFYIKQGGLAIYGAVIAAFITLFVYAKVKKQNALLMGDTAMPGLILGQAIGRWGNFMNREVFGEFYDGLLSMQLPVEAVRDSGDITANIEAHIPEGANYINVHPTFLYESLWNLLVLAVLLLWWKHRKFDGEACLLYLAGYGLGRFIIEGIRTDTLFLPGTTVPVSQVLSLVIVVFAVITDVVVRVRMTGKAVKN